MKTAKDRNKKCVKCGRMLPITDFYKKKVYYKNQVRPITKRKNSCKECHGKTVMNWRIKNKELVEIYKQNAEFKRRGLDHLVDNSKYRKYLYQKTEHGIERHRKRMINKKQILRMRRDILKIRNDEKNRADKRYAEIAEIIT